MFKCLSLYTCALCSSCATKLLFLPTLFSDPEDKVVTGRAQVGYMVDTNQALPQQKAAFHVSVMFISGCTYSQFFRF